MRAGSGRPVPGGRSCLLVAADDDRPDLLESGVNGCMALGQDRQLLLYQRQGTCSGGGRREVHPRHLPVDAQELVGAGEKALVEGNLEILEILELFGRPLVPGRIRRKSAGGLVESIPARGPFGTGLREDRHVGGEDGEGIAQRLLNQREIISPGPDSCTAQAFDVGRLSECPGDVDEVDRSISSREVRRPLAVGVRVYWRHRVTLPSPPRGLLEPTPDPCDLYHENRDGWWTAGGRWHKAGCGRPFLPAEPLCMPNAPQDSPSHPQAVPDPVPTPRLSRRGGTCFALSVPGTRRLPIR
jgi:hypothetical protein